jgi:tRNA 2-thiouridine synthesizing protein A
VIELRRRINCLEPLQTLHLIAADAGAPSDITAWCRMTGNALQRAEHPNYMIQRKGA